MLGMFSNSYKKKNHNATNQHPRKSQTSLAKFFKQDLEIECTTVFLGVRNKTFQGIVMKNLKKRKQRTGFKVNLRFSYGFCSKFDLFEKSCFLNSVSYHLQKKHVSLTESRSYHAIIP